MQGVEAAQREEKRPVPDQLPDAEASHHAKHRTNDIEGQRSEKCLQKRPQAKPKDLEHIRILT